MYAKSFQKNKSKKFSFQSSRFGGRNRFNHSSAGSRKFFKGERIDSCKFINKAVDEEKEEVFQPENSFQDFNIHQSLKQAVVSRGYKNPTPIQDKVIPLAINGSDLVGVANTGTGKTAAFLIPLINKVILKSEEKVLIVVPTRELALQIDQEFRSFTRSIRINSVCCVGGMSIGRQISSLRNFRYNFVVGTPGRLKDLMNRKMINLVRFNSVVLDEADRMLDMGFVNDTRFIINGMPKERQVLFFSATISSDIEKLIKEFLRNPIRISVKTRDTAKNVEQDIVRIERGRNKFDVLSDLLKKDEFNKVLVFGKTKHGVEKLTKNLNFNGVKAESIHGNKSSFQRQKAFELFKNNKVKVLVATDIAARGLDISNVSHVINYDIPATYTDYIHRIGRTGRGDNKGKALTFIES
jgi:superfamily II DNA/RNA helicase